MANTVISFERAESDGVHTSIVQVDPGGLNSSSATHYGPAGDDSHPLPGDTASRVASAGSGRGDVVGYIDTKNEPLAQPGERRIYSRNSDGDVVAVIWLKASGAIRIENVEGEGLVEVDTDGHVHLAESPAAAFLARADRCDAEIDRIWQVLTTWPVAPNDGGGALQTAANTAHGGVQSTASDRVHGT